MSENFASILERIGSVLVGASEIYRYICPLNRNQKSVAKGNMGQMCSVNPRNVLCIG